MVPSRLTFLRDTGEEELVESAPMCGLAETPPKEGQRFILTAPTGQIIKTGIIEKIEWTGKIVPAEYLVKNRNSKYTIRTYAVEGVQDQIACMFYTATSTYRWARVEDGEG
jgi:hypothetical protein